ncbi:TMEM175 family protein [Pelagerythrobacter aerophilus]|uniref:DUF1211 domain-containing protein n=1 Tax=Pelagerythrobacter aerophilus TaxID=2306995 RepID=A0A418NKF4_9SPHN|nr:TMEM175 family protein [Pelagerythrobacter aerophilus]RIV79659.1 DUF1211 domain-containing protein [Pelagerythrobacter aerophilus]
MPTNRLEAFSDGVLAIIITIMVLEMEVPHQATLSALAGLWPVFLSYVLSFVYIGIYWNNHHHLMAAADRVSGGILWANLHLLFWLSLLPFATGWMGENRFDTWPTIFYGLDLVACAIAYYILERSIVCVQGEDGMLARAMGRDFKGKLSPILYLVGIASTWLIAPLAGVAFFVLVAAIWIVPDRRIEREVARGR